MSSEASFSQKKNAKTVKQKIFSVLRTFFVSIGILMLIGGILHSTYFKNQYDRIEPYGQRVDVQDSQMHVYSMGQGDTTVVLLPGMGVALPSAEFGPLMRTLSKTYTAVCVEYFGVGFSGLTANPRTVENYVEETRAALAATGFEAPYVLMGHSISSVYCEFYAARYPDEVTAVISLDGTSTANYADMPAFVKSLLGVAKFQQAIGATSIIGALATQRDYLLDAGYTEKEINDMVTFAGFTMNDNSLKQIANSAEFIQDTLVLPYPASVPYFKVISKTTYETPNSQMKMTPQEYQSLHLARIGPQARYEILEGNHFIYVNNEERIAAIVGVVLEGQQP